MLNANAAVQRCIAAVNIMAVTLTFALYAAEPDLNAPLPVDPGVIIGTLPNQFQYWICATKKMPKVASCLYVASGSLNENNDQCGLAHFLEHMAFTGSQNFSPGTIDSYFESLGMNTRQGQDLNAFTSYTSTTYRLGLPDNNLATIEKALQCLSDFGYRLLLPDEKMDVERRVILSEIHRASGAAQRIREQFTKIAMPESRFSKRQIFGQEDTIKTASRQNMLDYYQKWYRPDDTTLLIAGDFAPDAIVKCIQANFSAWKALPNQETRADPEINSYTTVRAGVIADPELSEIEVRAIRISPFKPTKTVGDFRRNLMSALATSMFNRRFTALIEAGRAPFRNAVSTASTSMDVYCDCEVMATEGGDGSPTTSKTGKSWSAMLTSMLVEIKRARDFGFFQQELEHEKKLMIAEATRNARENGTLDAAEFVNQMSRCLSKMERPMSKSQRLNLTKELLPTITCSDIAAWFNDSFNPAARLLLVTMPLKHGLEVPTERDILDIAAKAEAQAVEPVQPQTELSTLLTAEPVPGTVASQKVLRRQRTIISRLEGDPLLKDVLVKLSNGVRLTLGGKDEATADASATILIRRSSKETAENRGIPEAARLIFERPSTANLSSTRIHETMTGKDVTIFNDPDANGLSIHIHSPLATLEDGLRLVHLILTQGRIEASALSAWKAQMQLDNEKRKTSVRSQLEEKRRTLIGRREPELAPIEQDQLDRITLSDAQHWLDETVTNGSIELSFYGVERGRALQLALKYLGSLPKRRYSADENDRDDRDGEDNTEETKVQPVFKGPLNAVVQVETITPRAAGWIGWRGADNSNDSKILSLAGSILTVRLFAELRLKRGLLYTLECGVESVNNRGVSTPHQDLFLWGSAETGNEGEEFLSISFDADPDKAAEISRVTNELVQSFAKEGPTEAELKTARKQIENAWEAGDGDESEKQQLLSYSREQIVEVLTRCVTPERHVEIIALPVKPSGRSRDK